ncbi:hypothetical protein C1H46_017961 [Malus baccata]|uniref:Uncharacterized protein n=1 Tax=Malus baccata TaxID=106549 RepID=A0A540MCJ7_MALBA|nr:hypothetical protein C1H46_017961 [Malus baccata]
MFFRGAGEGISALFASDHHGSPAIDSIQLTRSPICAEGAQSQLSPSSVQAPPLLSSSPLLQALATSAVKPHSMDSAAATVLLPESKAGIHASTMTSAPRLLHEHSFSDTTKNRPEVVLNLSIISATSAVKFPSLLTDNYGAYLKDKFGWVHWYLVGKFVKKDVYALELFEKMSEKSSEDKMEISHRRDLYSFVFTNYIWNPSGCTIIVKWQGISVAFHHYATSEPQIGYELFQFKNMEFDQAAKGIENVGVRWISPPTASILILLFEEIIARRLDYLVPIYLATKAYLMNAISKNVVRLKEFFRPLNPVLSQEIACYMGLALGWIMIKGFADDEIYVQLHKSVRGCDVYLVQPTCPPANEKFMELLVMSVTCWLTAGKKIHEYLFKVGLTGNSQVTNAQLDLYAKSEANIITGISNTAIKITIQLWINFGFAYTCSLFNFLNLETSIYSTIETSSVLSSCVRQPQAENPKQGPDLSMYSCGKKRWAILFEDNCFLVKEMVYLAEMKQYFLDDANLSDAPPLNPRKSLIAQTSYFQEVISVVANNLTSSLNLEIEVTLLLQGDGTTPASILMFLFREMYFKECGKSGTKPYVTETKQQFVSHHIFSHMIGKEAILLGDMAHISVLVTASVIPSPSEYADMVKTTGHKSPSNFPKLVESLFEESYDIVSGGTENHLVSLNLRDIGIDGSGAEKVMESVHIAAIKNNVPGYVFVVVFVGVLSIESPFSFETIIGVEGLEIDK